MRTLWFRAIVGTLAIGGFGILAQGGPAENAPQLAPPPAESTPPATTETPPPRPVENPADVLPNVKYIQKLLDVNNATYADGYRLAYILDRETVDAGEESRQRLTFTQLREQLIKNGIMNEHWSDDPTKLLTHQDAAYLLGRAMRLEGGILWSLTQTRRYAHRDMIEQRLFPDINPRQYISGPQLLSAYRACKDNMLKSSGR
ncbi:MAG: hypothetical protein L6Q71_12470 [Planctomycetes bacterium]|nr:hypothetical protein [Planctomycetota bacterium]NUQ34469.1 hypothetical protein [Planctomycetaceae bacterium]